MKRGAFEWIFGGIIVLLLILLVILFINNSNSTGNVINSQVNLITPTDSEEKGKTLVDEQKSMDRGKYYIQSFYVSGESSIFINLDSDDIINYLLLPDSDVERYKLDKSYNSYDTRSRIVFLQKHYYDLEPGQYSVVISSMTKPVNFHLVIKED